jgi:hypothetical protein
MKLKTLAKILKVAGLFPDLIPDLVPDLVPDLLHRRLAHTGAAPQSDANEALGFQPIPCLANGRPAEAPLKDQLSCGQWRCRSVLSFSSEGVGRLNDQQAMAFFAIAARRKNSFHSSHFVYIQFHGV